MGIVILGGELRGMPLTLPKNAIHTRPTSQMLARKLFDRFQSFEDVFFYDLCAGTGRMGLEAISRGARGAAFWEEEHSTFKNSLAINIEKVCQKIGIQPLLEVYSFSFQKSLTRLKEQSEEVRLFFYFDPPYQRSDLYHYFIDFIESKSLYEKAHIAIEYDRLKTTEDVKKRILLLNPEKIYTHSDHCLALW
jgi:16S rRNA (guanine966-N2)-methyltransferase